MTLQIMTNFSIYGAESRPYWPGAAYVSARSQGVRKAPSRSLECPGGRRNAGIWGGWALAIPMWGLGGCIPGTTPSHPTRYARPPRHSRTPGPSAHLGSPRLTTASRSPIQLRYDSFEATKEILGVEYAQHARGRTQYPRAPHCGTLLIGSLQQALILPALDTPGLRYTWP